MRTFSKRFAAVALSAAVAGAFFAPAIASAEEPEADCAALTADLQAAVTALTTAVAVPVRDTAELPGLPVGGDPLTAVLDVKAAISALAEGGCLPAPPTEPGAEVTLCIELAVDLNLDVSAVVAAVVNVGGPDLTAAADAAADLSTTLTALVSAGCLTGTAPV